MKKTLLVAVFAVAGLTASAQTEKGTMTLGGTFSYDQQKDDGSDSKSTNLTILPDFSYFVQNNVAIGVGIGYTSMESFSGDKLSAFAVMPYGRYYKSLSDQFKFFGQLAVPMAFGSAEDEDGNDLGETTTIGVSLSPGFAFFPTKRFALELGFNGINYQNTDVKNGEGNSSFSIGADFFDPQFGVRFHF